MLNSESSGPSMKLGIAKQEAFWSNFCITRRSRRIKNLKREKCPEKPSQILVRETKYEVKKIFSPNTTSGYAILNCKYHS